MKRTTKKYKTPVKPWDRQRIDREREIIKSFGLRRKKEIWRAENFLRKFRRMARELEARRNKEKESMLIKKMVKFGLLSEEANLDEVLGLTLDKLLERRLQTIIFRKGLANTPKQARQFITHGHVLIGNKRVTFPSYIVAKSEEDKIQVRAIASKTSKMMENATNG